jgi:beta-galactosidase GanA
MARTSLFLSNYQKQLHHHLEVSIKEEQIYSGEGCCPWLGCCSLFFRDLSRFALQLFQLLCNGQNFSLMEQLTETITPSFGSMYQKRTSIHRRGVLVLVGLSSLFFRDLSRFALQLFQLLCNGQNFSLIGKLTETITPSFGSTYQGRTSILRRGVLVLFGLLQPLFP